MGALSNIFRSLRNRSAGPAGLYDTALALLKTNTRALGADTTLLTSNGASVTTAVIQIDLATGDCLVAGEYKRFAALNDQPIVGTAAWTKSFKLNGTAAAVLSADAKDYQIAIVVVNVADVPTLYAVFGAEAATGAAVDPTAAQIHAALAAAAVADMDTTAVLVIGRILAARAAGAVALTHTNPGTAGAAGDALKAERIFGSVVAGYAGT